MSALYPTLLESDPNATVDVPNNALILHDGEHLVLLDTGLPAGTDDGLDAPIHGALRELDFARESVVAVILSHLHPDHLGPLLTQQENSTAFPNARFYVHRDEWAYFSDDRNLERHRGRVADAVRIALPLLAQSKLILFEEPCEPYAGIRVRLADGHTPGHCITEIGTSATAIYLADLVAHQRQLDEPTLPSGFDHARDRAQYTRVAELRDARERHMRIVGSHLAFAAADHPWPSRQPS